MAKSAGNPEQEGDNQSTTETEYNSISVDLKTATRSELNGWILEKAQDYRDCPEASNELHYIFCDDFDRWTKETFQKANSTNVRALREVLLSKGIFTPKNNKPVATHLVKLLETEEIDPWPEDVEQPIALLAYNVRKGT
jgi:hypothetical protein